MATATRNEDRRTARRANLVDAAMAVFSAKGVAATSVDDIVRAAGVAKGTFYLYFETKDDAVNAVAERMIEGVADRVQAVASAPGISPVERLLGLGDAMREVGDEPYERDLIAIMHRPDNRAFHDRMSERALARLAPVIAHVIADGIEMGLFRDQEPVRAAAFVMGALGALHDVVSQPDELEAATRELNCFLLRGLGYAGEIVP